MRSGYISSGRFNSQYAGLAGYARTASAAEEDIASILSFFNPGVSIGTSHRINAFPVRA